MGRTSTARGQPTPAEIVRLLRRRRRAITAFWWSSTALGIMVLEVLVTLPFQSWLLGAIVKTQAVRILPALSLACVFACTALAGVFVTSATLYYRTAGQLQCIDYHFCTGCGSRLTQLPKATCPNCGRGIRASLNELRKITQQRPDHADLSAAVRKVLPPPRVRSLVRRSKLVRIWTACALPAWAVLLAGTAAMTLSAWQSQVRLQHLGKGGLSLVQQRQNWQAAREAQRRAVRISRIHGILFFSVSGSTVLLGVVGRLAISKLRRLGYAYCTRCGYPLVGVASPACPECGQSKQVSRREHLGLMPVKPIPMPPAMLLCLRRTKRPMTVLGVLACLASLVLCAYAIWRAARAW